MRFLFMAFYHFKDERCMRNALYPTLAFSFGNLGFGLPRFV